MAGSSGLSQREKEEKENVHPEADEGVDADIDMGLDADADAWTDSLSRLGLDLDQTPEPPTSIPASISTMARTGLRESKKGSV